VSAANWPIWLMIFYNIIRLLSDWMKIVAENPIKAFLS